MFSFSGSSNDTVFFVVALATLDAGREKLDFSPGVGLVVGTSVEMVPAPSSLLGADGAGRFLVAFLGVWPGAASGSLSLGSSIV
ncbi:hypothetical protein Micbo1qcDRAFT_162835, partial [Microdochium bolleyi]